MRSVSIAGLALGVAAACGPPSDFLCQTDGQCAGGGAAGTCLADGFCGFEAEDCDSGLRYGEQSGPRSGQCVPVAGTGTTSGPVGAASSSSGAQTGATTLSLDDEGTDTGDSTTTDEPQTSTSDTVGDSVTSTGASLDPSLVLWLPLADLDGPDIVDASGNENHGACSEASCPVPATGHDNGGAASFDGVDDYVMVPHSASLETVSAFTASVWVRREEPPVEQRSVFTKPVGDGVFNSWELYFFGGAMQDNVRFSMANGVNDTTVTDPNPFPIGEWVHVAGTWDGEAMRLYIDGVAVAEGRMTGIQMDDHPVYVGVDDDHDEAGLDGFFDGAIDDARLYDRALAPEEIANLLRSP